MLHQRNMNKRSLLRLQGISFILTNLMGTIPGFVITQISVYHNGLDKYVLPIVLYFCFKTTVLLVIRRNYFDCRRLLNFSLLSGVLGCLLGLFIDYSYICIVLSGVLLGITSGTAFPAYRTISFHEDKYNQFKMSSIDKKIQLIYGILLSGFLLYFILTNIKVAFLFLGINILVTFFIVRKFPKYKSEQTISIPKYSLLGTISLFIATFSAIYTVKISVELGKDKYLLISFIVMLFFFGCYFLIRHSKERPRLPKFYTALFLFQGIILNFVFVFCTFYKVLFTGSKSLYIVYVLYVIGLLSGAKIIKLLTNFFRPEHYFHLYSLGIFSGLFLVSLRYTFYVGIFILSIFITHMNRRLNRIFYHYKELPEETRLLTKYRITNIGSILQQVVMLVVISISVSFSSKVNVSDVFYSSGINTIQERIFVYLIITKFVLILFFSMFLFYLLSYYNKKGQLELLAIEN